LKKRHGIKHAQYSLPYFFKPNPIQGNCKRPQTNTTQIARFKQFRQKLIFLVDRIFGLADIQLAVMGKKRINEKKKNDGKIFFWGI